MTTEQAMEIIYKLQKVRYSGLIKSKSALNFIHNFTQELKKQLENNEVNDGLYNILD